MAGNSLEAAVCVWAILRAGGVVVPLSAESRAARIRGITHDCGARMVIAAPENAAGVSGALGGTGIRLVWTTPPAGRHAEPSIADALARSEMKAADPRLIDQDLAAIIYTSGTTGEPKGVMLTHRNLSNTTQAIASYLGQTSDDVVCCMLPLAFSYGLFQLFTSARMGSSVLLERSFAFPFDVLKRVEEHRVTMIPGVPTMFTKILEMLPLEGVDLGAVRCVTNAAAPLPPAHMRRLLAALPQAGVYAMYGQTECTRATYLSPHLAASRPDSVGRAIPNCEVFLVDEKGRRLPAESQGELVVRGANVMRGYWGRTESTARKLRDDVVPGEVVLMTGDTFRTDRDGLLYFVSRTDDIFKCRGEKVAPCAVEHVLCELPEVSEAAVVGVEDPGDGMAIKAVIVVRSGHELSESRIRQHCRARLEAALMPRYIEMCTELPKTESGKVRRAGLRARMSA